MTNLTKVIIGLGCHISDPEGHLDCDTCPYSRRATGDNSISNSAGCLNRLHIDALELLKEQNPHVLTWDEMVEAGKNHEAVYLEEHENAYQKRFWGIAVEGIEPPKRGYNYPGGTQFNVVDADDDIWDGDLYGLDASLGWRAWNRKPTEEQMKAAKWN